MVYRCVGNSLEVLEEVVHLGSTKYRHLTYYSFYGLVVLLMVLQNVHLSTGNPCPVSEHTCDNLRCVPRDKVCNGQDDCGDNSDEKAGCTPCNVTYYGEVGKSYELDLRESRALHPPFTCHLTFVAAGDIYGDLIQIVFREMLLGTFRSHHVYGCPQGELSVSEARRPHVPGFWCGTTHDHNAYYSETNTVTVTVKVPEPKDELVIPKPFKLKLYYKFLLGAKSVVRFGPWNSAKYLGFPRPGTVCDRVFDSCDRRKCRVQSPNYPGQYPRNLTCQYIISQTTVPHGRHALTSISQPNSGFVHIKHTDGDCSADKLSLYLDSDCDVVGDTLSIYEIHGESRKLLLSFCGGGKIPHVTASGSQILLVFQTSPYDNMYFDPSIRTYPGFEFDVGVAFVPKNSFLYAEDKCEFLITSYKTSIGFFENVAHSLPRNTKCVYRFEGRPDEVIWLYFTRLKSSYSLPAARDTPHCKTNVTLVEGNQENGPVLESTCSHMGIKVCHREQLGPGKNRPRPCNTQESYLTSGSIAFLTIHYIFPSAIATFDFRLHYEFVYAGPKAEALKQPESCDRFINSSRSKQGLIASPSNNLLYGKFGKTNLKCKYSLRGKENEVVRITFISFYAHNSSCPRTGSPMQECGRPTPLEGRGARLEVAEFPWDKIELPLACLCHSDSLPATLMSFSPSVSIQFSTSGMSVFDDYSHFSFELEYEFVEVEPCNENRIVKGDAGLLNLHLKSNTGPCRGHPWLLRPSPHRFLLVTVPGRSIMRDPDEDYLSRFISFDDIPHVEVCEGPEIHVYQPGNPKPISAVCVDFTNSRNVHVFSHGFKDPWSLDYLSINARSLIVVLVTRPQYMSGKAIANKYDSVAVKWIESAPKWLISRCVTQCPEVHACISASLFCDGSWHCPSGADEAIGTCLMALSPWLWLLFGLLFGSFSVLIGWWLRTLWLKHKSNISLASRSKEQVLSPAHQETPPEPPECEYPSCFDIDFETTV